MYFGGKTKSLGGITQVERWLDVGYPTRDFYAVVSKRDMRGRDSNSTNYELSGLRSFVEDIKLVDLLVLGKKLSWFKENRSAMSYLIYILMYLRIT